MIVERQRGRWPAHQALPPISDEQRLADSLAGVIRVRAVDATAPEVRHAARVRGEVKGVLYAAGIPFISSGLAFDVERGAIVAFRLTDDVVEYVWAPDAHTKVRSSIASLAAFSLPGELLGQG